MNRSLYSGQQARPVALRRSYQARQKILLRRCIAAAVFVHLTVLAWPDGPISVPNPLAVPSLQVLLRPSALEPVSTVETRGAPRRSSETPSPVAFAPRQAGAGPEGTGGDSSAAAHDAERLNHLQTLLRGALDRQFVYPPLARSHGWQGKVELSAELDASGRL